MVFWFFLGFLPTDLELLGSAVDAAVDSLPWAGLPDSLAVEAQGGNWAWLLAKRAQLRAQREGKALGSGAVLELRAGEMGVGYRLLSGPLPWSPRRVERAARVVVYATLGMGNRVASVWELRGEAVDTVPLDLLPGLRVNGLSPPLPKAQEGILEPVLAALVMGSLLYIFWVFESQ